MKVSEVVKTFGLTPKQSRALRSAVIDPAKAKLADQLHKHAIAVPTALEVAKSQLLAMVDGAAPQSIPAGAPQPPAVKVAPPPPPAVKQIAWVIVGGNPVAYVPGMIIAPGQLVCYAGDESSAEPWKPFQPAGAAVKPTETRINTDDSTIPASPANPRYKLPWILGANISATASDGKVYATFGYRNGTKFNYCSVQLAELLQVLESPQHVADMVRLLRDYKARLGG